MIFSQNNILQIKFYILKHNSLQKKKITLLTNSTKEFE